MQLRHLPPDFVPPDGRFEPERGPAHPAGNSVVKAAVPGARPVLHAVPAEPAAAVHAGEAAPDKPLPEEDAGLLLPVNRAPSAFAPITDDVRANLPGRPAG